MKLKKVLSGFLSAAILATTTAIVMPMSASAAEEMTPHTIYEYDDSQIGVFEELTLGDDVKNATSSISVLVTGSTVEGAEWSAYYIQECDSWACGDGVSLGTAITVTSTDALWSGIKTGGAKINLQNAKATTVTLTIDSNDETLLFDASTAPAGKTYDANGGTMTISAADLDTCGVTEANIADCTVDVTYTTAPSGAVCGINVNNDWDKNFFYKDQISSATVNLPFTGIAGNHWQTQEPYDYREAALADGIMIQFKSCSVSKVVLNVPATVAVEEVTVEPATLALKVGDAASALTATVTPEGADQGVTWITSNNKVATVTADGKVTAVASGTATITATSTADETKTAECKVTVTNPATAIAIDKTASVLVGATKLLAVTTTPADADELTYTWITSDASIATVADGVVTGVAAGTAKITVTAGALTASCDVTVTAEEKPITKLEISDATLELEEGKTGTLTSTTTPSDTTDEIEWVSSDPSVATVKDGVVTAVKAGKATITVQVKGNEEISASCEVTVTAKAPEIETKPYTLNVVDASGWGEAGVTRAAQVNVPVTTLNGFKVGTTTYKDVKDKTLKLENLAFGSCTAAGVKAENVDVCIYLQFGSGWTWCATGGNTLADGSVEYDLSTLASANGVKDTDVLQQIGFQFNIKGNVGGINDMAENTKVTLNAAEPKFTVVGEEPSNYETGKVETVEGYVPASTEAGKKTELVVMSITETEAARNDSYTITVSDGTKTYTTTTNDCYKGFKYNTATGEKTENAANGYFIIVKVTGVPEGTNITVTIEPTK